MSDSSTSCQVVITFRAPLSVHFLEQNHSFLSKTSIKKNRFIMTILRVSFNNERLNIHISNLKIFTYRPIKAKTNFTTFSRF